MKYQIITIGGATRDITFLTPEGVLIDNHQDILRQKLLAFEYGAKIKVDRFHYLFGGGAANAAVNFAQSGFLAACLVKVGKDNDGQEIINNLREHQVASSLVEVDAQASTGLSFVLVSEAGERIIFTNRAANKGLRIEKKEQSLLNRADWLYLSSLSGDWLKTARQIFSLDQPRIAWNPGVAQYQAGLKKLAPFLKKTEVLCVNKDEAIELVLSDDRYKNKNDKFLNDIKNLLSILKEAGPSIILITNGAEGASVYDGQDFYHQAVLQTKKKVDITGVGDVFNSSFIIGLELSGHDIKRALYLGAKNAASKISYFGAQNGLLDLRKVK